MFVFDYLGFYFWIITGIAICFRVSHHPSVLWKYYINMLISFDQLFNALLLGDPDETISGRLGRGLKSRHTYFFVKPLALFVDGLAYLLAGEKNHCINSIEPEEPIYKKENKNANIISFRFFS